MASFESVLDEVKQLSQDDQLRLFDALWKIVPEETGLPLHDDWAAELERRVAAIRVGTATTAPRETIRNEALARFGHGASH